MLTKTQKRTKLPVRSSFSQTAQCQVALACVTCRCAWQWLQYTSGIDPLRPKKQMGATEAAPLSNRPSCGRLSRLLHYRHAHVALLNHVGGDLEFLHAPLAGQVVHEVEHQLFQDHAQAARPDFARHCLLR